MFYFFKTSLITSAIFLITVCSIIFKNPEMFLKRLGRFHSLTGFSYLLLILLGFYDIVFPLKLRDSFYLSYDILVGIVGTLLPLTAAYEFKHRHIKNTASGTLDEHATVTYDEMIEHSFYQILNLLQIIYIHLFTFFPNITLSNSIVSCFVVTSPWLIRHLFPIHKFSDNYNKIDERSNMMIRILYRLKKYQYIFYKHFLLHGLNLSLALYPLQIFNITNAQKVGMSEGGNNYLILGNNRYFRLYWLLLNTSYVMEFFLQTLVKKKYLLQSSMLYLQQLLMFASTCAALFVLNHIKFILASLSFIMNILNRKYDFFNIVFIAAFILFIQVIT